MAVATVCLSSLVSRVGERGGVVVEFVGEVLAVAAGPALGADLDDGGVIEEVLVVALGGEAVFEVEGVGQHSGVVEEVVVVEVVVDLAVRGDVPDGRGGGVHSGVAGSLGVVSQYVVDEVYELCGGLFDGEGLEVL